MELLGDRNVAAPTAAAVARATGQTRQNAAYHVRELEKVGLLRHAGSGRRATSASSSTSPPRRPS